ncbi:TOMM precursor leader peptide-binding protein [Nocardia sp. NPDC057668]|uniref:TOMM precursor leader peptide-binding protein n=1 Tax=Nocardia sp. NPDC057668 TaxID=3346202 RepID=UPI00366D2FEC
MTTLARTSGPALDPRITVLRRTDGAVQLGWDPEHALVLRAPGTPHQLWELLRLLDGMHTRAQIRSEAAAFGLAKELTDALLDELSAAGLLHDAPPPARLRSVRVHGRGPLSDALLAGVQRIGLRPSRSHDTNAFGLLQPHGSGAGEPCSGGLHAAHSSGPHDSHSGGPCTAHSGGPRDSRGSGPRKARGGGAGEAAGLVVLADALVPDPALTQQLVRRRIPHLQVRIRDGRGVVGPLVLPGTSSCLRCADLHRCDREPEWPHLSAQLLGRAGYAAPAVIAATAALALAEIAAIMRGAADRPPVTLDTTLELDPEIYRIARRPWPAHPRCGCRAFQPLSQPNSLSPAPNRPRAAIAGRLGCDGSHLPLPPARTVNSHGEPSGTSA